MKTTRFKTDRWLWLGVSLALFVVGWFIPFNYARGYFFSIYKWVKHSIVGDYYGDVALLFVGDDPYPMGRVICLWGGVSFFIGWWIQRVVVKSRTGKRDEIDHVA